MYACMYMRHTVCYSCLAVCYSMSSVGLLHKCRQTMSCSCRVLQCGAGWCRVVHGDTLFRVLSCCMNAGTWLILKKTMCAMSHSYAWSDTFILYQQYVTRAYMYAHIYMNTYIYTHTHIYTHIHKHTSTHALTHTHIHTHIHTHTHTPTHKHTYIFVHIYTYIHIHIHVYT